MPHRFFHIRSNPASGAKFRAKFFDSGAGHIAANDLSKLLAIVIVQGIADDAGKAGAPLDLLHTLHLPTPTNAARSSRTKSRTASRSASTTPNTPSLRTSWLRLFAKPAVAAQAA